MISFGSLIFNFLSEEMFVKRLFVSFILVALILSFLACVDRAWAGTCHGLRT